ncbi:MAG: hypothetical protein R3D44_02945 [Hyphomicrobiaceae bacterium]
MAIIFNQFSYAVRNRAAWSRAKEKVFGILRDKTLQTIGARLGKGRRPPSRVHETHEATVVRRGKVQAVTWLMISRVAQSGSCCEVTVEYFGLENRLHELEASIGDLLHSERVNDEYYETSWTGKTFVIEARPTVNPPRSPRTNWSEIRHLSSQTNLCPVDADRYEYRDDFRFPPYVAFACRIAQFTPEIKSFNNIRSTGPALERNPPTQEVGAPARGHGYDTHSHNGATGNYGTLRDARRARTAPRLPFCLNAWRANKTLSFLSSSREPHDFPDCSSLPCHEAVRAGDFLQHLAEMSPLPFHCDGEK